MSRWETRAACRGMDPELFFPIGQVAPSTLRVCRSLCGVREACLDEALASGHHGIWGGTTSGERRVLRRSALLNLTARTTTETTPMDEQNDVTEITEALLDGRTVKDVAEAHEWPRQRVTALINGTEGWSLDAHTDTVVIGRRHGDEATVDLTGHDQANEHDEDQGDETNADDVNLSGLEALLRRAEESKVPATRTAAEKTRAVVDDLLQRVKTEAAEKQILDQIAELEAKLAAARTELKEIRPGKTTKSAARRPAADGPSPKDVRAWAAARGIECSPYGRVPEPIVEKYLADQATAGAGV